VEGEHADGATFTLEAMSLEHTRDNIACREVGGLILRGCRCVLVRSLSGAWKGMRIPTTFAGKPNEIPAVTALCAVSELCDIHASEVEVLAGVPPAHTYTTRLGKTRPVAIYTLYAVNPPPLGPLEAADVEDPEDSYDWYTFPRAMQALASDPFAQAALAALAVSLAAGAAAGAVPDKWGGVFGQEWTGPALDLVPGVAEDTSRGIHLVPATIPFAPYRPQLPSQQTTATASRLRKGFTGREGRKRRCSRHAECKHNDSQLPSSSKVP